MAQITAPLDSDWSTLPAKPDYVAFLHELVFHLAGGAAPSRNVMIGEPLVMPVAKGTQPHQFVFKDPAGKDHAAELGGDEARPVLQYDKADLPGLYRLLPVDQAANAAAVGEQFVVEFDRGESDLKPLDDAARKQLAGEGRLKFVQNLDELTTEFYTDGPEVGDLARADGAPAPVPRRGAAADPPPRPRRPRANRHRAGSRRSGPGGVKQ